jgi:hypothetical protein
MKIIFGVGFLCCLISIAWTFQEVHKEGKLVGPENYPIHRSLTLNNIGEKSRQQIRQRPGLPINTNLVPGQLSDFQ